MSRRIVVAEDNPITRRMMRFALESEGYQVVDAADGHQALAAARRQMPDLVIQDYVLPDMDGLQLLQQLRALPGGTEVPVLLVTGMASMIEDLRRQAVGPITILSKPLEPSRMLQIVQSELGRAPLAPVDPPRDDGPPVRLDVELRQQVERNEALLRQGAIQAAALSVVRGLAQALAQPRDIGAVLGDVLVHCLDAAGLSSGLLYLRSDDGSLRLQTQAGLSAAARAGAADAFGYPEVLQAALAAGRPVALDGGSEPAMEGFARGLERRSCLIVPFVVGAERLGALVLASDGQDLAEPAWQGFATALASQFGQTLALGRFMERGAASEVRYQTLMEHANDAILLLDGGGVVVQANRQAGVLLGRPVAAIVGRAYSEFVAAEERDTLVKGTGRFQGRHLVRPDGAPVVADLSVAAVEVGGETLELVILHDVTRRERAEEQLRQVQARLQHVLSSSPAVLYTLSLVGETRVPSWVSPNIERVSGYSPEEVGVPPWWEERVHPDDRERLAGDGALLLATGQVQREYRLRFKDGTYRWVRDEQRLIRDAAGRPAEVVGSWWDVADKVSLEGQLRQAQKMEAVGQLAGGIAHDFNNLLGVITGYADLLLKDLGAHHPGTRRAREIRHAAERAADLTRQLLAFSRKQVLDPKVLLLDDVVRGVLGMLGRLIGEQVEVVTALGATQARVRADPGQLEQVIVNLAVNARDAMPEGGRLTLSTAAVVLDEVQARAHPAAQPGPHVMLAVADSGHGMDAETLAHIFEPFFTTKEPGKGTGLGLATVFGIVEQSGGYLDVQSAPGQGTTFRIFLPRVDDEPEIALARPAPVAPAAPAGEQVLLVEDSEALRDLIREVLDDAGYRVLAASGPEEALALASQAPRLDLVLSDVVMPGMNGRAMVEGLRRHHPAVRVIFMSGYAAEEAGPRLLADTGASFLEKPFAAAAMLQKVREVLGH